MELLEKHFDTAFAAANGVKRLRQLIWNLAVQGKLVPQDSNDPPALELLEKAREKKQKLIEEKKIRKPKSSLKLSETDLPYELPCGWEWVRFGDISINRDAERIPISKDQRKGTQGIYDYYGASGVIDKINDYIFEEELLLIGEDGANLVNRSTPIAFIARGKYWVNNHAHVIDAHDRDLLLYLEKYINAIDLKPYVTGTAQPKMNQVKMNSIMVALPPIPEQRRIVAKIDQLMARCDELEKLKVARDRLQITVHKVACDRLLTAKDPDTFTQSWQFITQHFNELYSVKENVTELRKTILQLAVMGKLSPQNPKDPLASELIKKITIEKQRLLKEKTIRQEKLLPEINQEEIPYELPKNWQWVRLGYVGQFINGDRGKSYPNKNEYVDEGIPWINTGHIEPDGSLTHSEMNFITRDKFDSLRSGKIESGDLVYCLRGATFGKTAIVDPYQEGAIASSLMIIRPFQPCLNWYMYWYLISPIGRQQIFRFNNGSAQPNLSANSVRLYVYPLPPLPEQHRIVAKVNQLMTLCDQLEQQIDKSTQTQTALLNATLANI